MLVCEKKFENLYYKIMSMENVYLIKNFFFIQNYIYAKNYNIKHIPVKFYLTSIVFSRIKNLRFFLSLTENNKNLIFLKFFAVIGVFFEIFKIFILDLCYLFILFKCIFPNWEFIVENKHVVLIVIFVKQQINYFLIFSVLC